MVEFQVVFQRHRDSWDLYWTEMVGLSTVPTGMMHAIQELTEKPWGQKRITAERWEVCLDRSGMKWRLTLEGWGIPLTELELFDAEVDKLHEVTSPAAMETQRQELREVPEHHEQPIEMQEPGQHAGGDDVPQGSVDAASNFGALDLDELREEYARTRRFDVETFVTKHGLAVVKEVPARDGARQFILETCPFNISHDNGCAYFIQYLNGNCLFKCHHNSCKGKTWADVVALCESPRQDEAPSKT